MNKTKTYLGDSVYADIDSSNRVVLTTENGISISNEIILEQEVINNFTLWLAKIDSEKYPYRTDT